MIVSLLLTAVPRHHRPVFVLIIKMSTKTAVPRHHRLVFVLILNFCFFFTAEPLPLLDLCRRVIRQTITKERIEQGKIAELNLPKTIKDYLEYKDRRVATDVS